MYLSFFFSFADFDLRLALPNQQTVEYPSFKLVIVGDGGTALFLNICYRNNAMMHEVCVWFPTVTFQLSKNLILVLNLGKLKTSLLP
ncbi:hypothetical protein RchiOBHm_Chr1g0327941 [Rosa chinensis]|uniref:Uncharacterized protein n=1 Tax=Rosa chinensis TaxID=74649 RepID=A0A2P6SAP8_ROSCH|nr:hypothetical protein RchiOBHm_Chr1g0327941 [Rosa chinensis]